MTVRRLLALVALALGVVVAVAGPAAAHARLVDSDPAASAVLAEAPTELVLRFDEEVDASLGGVVLLDQSGTTVADLAFAGVPGQPEAVRADLPELGAGVYVAEWRVTSADSHPVSGAFPFRVGEGSAPTVDQIGSLPSTDGGGLSFALGATRWFTYVGLALLVGGAAFVAVAWPAGAGWWPARRIAWFGWAFTLAASLGAFALQGPYAAGLPAGRALDPDVWRDVVQTRFGQAQVVRVGLLLLALPLLAQLVRGVTRGWMALGAVVAVGLAASVALAGHAGTGRLPVLGLVAGTGHTAAMAWWLGGLVVLGLVLLVPPVARSAGAGVPGADDPAPAGSEDAEPPSGSVATALDAAAAPAPTAGNEVDDAGASAPPAGSEVDAAAAPAPASGRAGDEGAPVDTGGPVPTPSASAPVDGARPPGAAGELLAAVQRFSSTALVAVAVVVVTGVVQAWRMVGGPAGLTDSRWGRTLLVKLALVVVVLALAWVSRRVVRRRWPAAGSLRRTVLAEVALGALVLVASVALVQTSPQADAAPRVPFTAALVQGNVVADVTVSPAAVGEAELHLLVTVPGGALQRAQSAEVRLTLPERNLGPVPVPLVDEGPNHWSAPSLELPYAGEWTLEIRVTTADGSLVRLTTPMPVTG